jgi:1-hydroxycarotenoid 3,4-desaturase
LRAQFSDPRLRQLFGRYATYVGGAPEATPAVLALIWQAEARGVWVVEGGMARLAAALADLARAGGAEIRLNTPVAEVLQHAGRTVGVRLSDGSEIAAEAVVFNGDPAALHTGLLGQAATQAVPAQGVTPRSLSAWVWAFGATAEGPRAPDLAHHNVFFGPDPAAEFGPIAKGAMPDAPTLYVCAQDRGTAHPPTAPHTPGPERFEIIMNAPAMPPDANREEAQCNTRTFQTLARMGLSFSPAPSSAALTAPPDFAAMFPASSGSLYGRSPQGALAAFARPTARTRVPGLYLAGGGAHPGAGVPMATLSGRHAAEAIAADLALPLRSRPTATPGGISTVSRTAAPAPSR